MDVDSVLEEIGELGPAQLKIVGLVNLASVVCAFHFLVFSFITADPGWFCPENNQTELESCAIVEEGTCTPKYYGNNFTSIVSEVRLTNNDA